MELIFADLYYLLGAIVTGIISYIILLVTNVKSNEECNKEDKIINLIIASALSFAWLLVWPILLIGAIIYLITIPLDYFIVRIINKINNRRR